MPRYINVDDIELKGIAVFDENLELLVPLSEVRKALQMTPTADVVPESEVEKLKAIIADHKANEERWQELYADTVDTWEKAYEELEIKLARLNAVMKEMDEQRAYTIYMLAESLENGKAEVAREIFGEIERTLDNYHYSNLLVGEIAPLSYYDAELEDAIAELRKKYTGGE